MTEAKHTLGPLIVGKFDDTGGYDCMYAGIDVGPFELDGANYGQLPCQDMSDEAKERMLADAARLALCWNTHDEAVALLKECLSCEFPVNEKAVIAKVEGFLKMIGEGA